MPNPWVPDPVPYTPPGDPIALSPQTYARHARAVNYVEGANNARYPYPRRGRTTTSAAGAWAVLPSGHTILAASGLHLGTGTVTLCSRDDNTLTADGEDIVVYNSGDAISAGGSDKIIKVSWTDGVWSAARCG